MNRVVLGVVILMAALGLLGASSGVAHHNSTGRLPGVPYTPLIQSALRTGVVYWCVNPDAEAYPGFVEQLQLVNDAATGRTTVANVRVPYGTGCQVQHDGRWDKFCEGCAAWIHYANWPVKVEYMLSLGYRNWYTTQAHEGTVCGHALGEDEGYQDAGTIQSFVLAYGYWASPWDAPHVMDVGTHLLSAWYPLGVYQCTEADMRVLSTWLLPQGEYGGGLSGRTAFYQAGDAAVTRVSVLFRTYAGYLYWSGAFLPDVADCASVWRICGAGTIPDPGRCQEVVLSYENALPASWGRKLVSLGWSPCV